MCNDRGTRAKSVMGYELFIYGIIQFGSKHGLSPCGSRHLQTNKIKNNAIRMNMHRFQCSEKECLYTYRSIILK